MYEIKSMWYRFSKSFFFNIKLYLINYLKYSFDDGYEIHLLTFSTYENSKTYQINFLWCQIEISR